MIINAPALDLPSMGAESAHAAVPSAAPSATPAAAPASTPAGDAAVSVSVNDGSLRGSAGNYTGTTTPVTAFDMEQTHARLQREADAINSKLDAHTFDAKTGQRRDTVTGRDREILHLQLAQLQREFEYQATLAVQELPKVGAAQDAQRDANVAAVNREVAISRVAEMLDNNGRPIGRIKAIEIVRRAEINKMVGEF